MIRIRSLVDQVEAWRSRLTAADDGTDGTDGTEEAATLAAAVAGDLADIEDRLVKGRELRHSARLDEPARLEEKLSSLIPVVASADARPTVQARELVELHSAQIDEQLARLEELVDGGLARLNELIAELAIPAIGA